MLEFERPFLDLQEQIQGLKTFCQTLPDDASQKIHIEIQKLEAKAEKVLADIYGKLTPWQKVQVARHPERPKTGDYIARMIQGFVPLAGDRCFGDDPAVVGGIGLFREMPVMVIGHEKGADTDSRVRHNFGMAHPEGYRKACRLMRQAEHWGMPVLFLVDTPGAYAGMQAEERGQSQAIADCIDVSLCLRVPVLSVIIGEGGSGGAVAFATANYVAMPEHSVYSVISPEGCASILWRTAEKREVAAAAQRLTAQDLLQFHIIDEIIPEPLGGAHRNRHAVIDHASDALYARLMQMVQESSQGVRFDEQRRARFLAIGQTFVTRPQF